MAHAKRVAHATRAYQKVEEVNGEISESEWERLFGTGVEEMEIEAEPEPEKEIRYKCNKCLHRSSTKEEYLEHIRTHIQNGLKCPTCNKEFKELKNLKKHIKNIHTVNNLNCPRT